MKLTFNMKLRYKIKNRENIELFKILCHINMTKTTKFLIFYDVTVNII